MESDAEDQEDSLLGSFVVEDDDVYGDDDAELLSGM